MSPVRSNLRQQNRCLVEVSHSRSKSCVTPDDLQSQAKQGMYIGNRFQIRWRGWCECASTGRFHLQPVSLCVPGAVHSPAGDFSGQNVQQMDALLDSASNTPTSYFYCPIYRRSLSRFGHLMISFLSLYSPETYGRLEEDQIHVHGKRGLNFPQGNLRFFRLIVQHRLRSLL